MMNRERDLHAHYADLLGAESDPRLLSLVSELDRLYTSVPSPMGPALGTLRALAGQHAARNRGRAAPHTTRWSAVFLSSLLLAMSIILLLVLRHRPLAGPSRHIVPATPTACATATLPPTPTPTTAPSMTATPFRTGNLVIAISIMCSIHPTPTLTVFPVKTATPGPSPTPTKLPTHSR